MTSFADAPKSVRLLREGSLHICILPARNQADGGVGWGPGVRPTYSPRIRSSYFSRLRITRKRSPSTKISGGRRRAL